MTTQHLTTTSLVIFLRQIIPYGTTIELISTNDPLTQLKQGDRGKVQFIDDECHIHVKWKSNLKMALIPFQDTFRVIKL